jgi:hypothetical protein
VGVGHNEDPGAPVGGPDVGRRKRDGSGIVSKSLQAPLHLTQEAAPARCDVFDDDPRRAEFFDDAALLVPEAGTGSRKAFATACAADVGARETPAEDVHGSESCRS